MIFACILAASFLAHVHADTCPVPANAGTQKAWNDCGKVGSFCLDSADYVRDAVVQVVCIPQPGADAGAFQAACTGDGLSWNDGKSGCNVDFRAVNSSAVDKNGNSVEGVEPLTRCTNELGGQGDDKKTCKTWSEYALLDVGNAGSTWKNVNQWKEGDPATCGSKWFTSTTDTLTDKHNAWKDWLGPRCCGSVKNLACVTGNGDGLTAEEEAAANPLNSAGAAKSDNKVNIGAILGGICGPLFGILGYLGWKNEQKKKNKNKTSNVAPTNAVAEAEASAKI